MKIQNLWEGGCTNMAKGNRGGKRASANSASAMNSASISVKTQNGNNGIKYLSADNALYESSDEVLYVERIVTNKGFGLGEDVLDAKSDGNGNLTLGYATPTQYYAQNSKTSYGLYELKCGITNASDINRYMKDTDYFSGKKSKFKDDNKSYDTRSVGIDWDKVNSVSGQTYNIKDLLKSKGFKWNSAGKNWVKS